MKTPTSPALNFDFQGTPVPVTEPLLGRPAHQGSPYSRAVLSRLPNILVCWYDLSFNVVFCVCVSCICLEMSECSDGIFLFLCAAVLCFCVTAVIFVVWVNFFCGLCGVKLQCFVEISVSYLCVCKCCVRCWVV